MQENNPEIKLNYLNDVPDPVTTPKSTNDPITEIVQNNSLDDAITVSDDLFNLYKNDNPANPTTIEQNIGSNTATSNSNEIDPDTNSEEEVLAAGLYDVLVQNGGIGKVEKFDGKLSTVQELIKNAPEQRFQQYLSTLPKVARDLIEYSSQLDDGATTKDLENYFNNVQKIENHSKELNLDDANVARSFMENAYKKENPDYDPDMIDAMLNILEDKGTLISKAKDKKTKELKDAAALNARLKQQAIDRKRDALEETATFNSKVASYIQSNEFWNDTRKTKVRTELTQENLQQKMHAINNSPELFGEFANFASYIKKDGTFDREGYMDNFKPDATALRNNMYSDQFRTILKSGSFSKPQNEGVTFGGRKMTPAKYTVTQ